jgi:hypothetical protein
MPASPSACGAGWRADAQYLNPTVKPKVRGSW